MIWEVTERTSAPSQQWHTVCFMPSTSAKAEWTRVVDNVGGNESRHPPALRAAVADTIQTQDIQP